jgi:hypothetical protein
MSILDIFKKKPPGSKKDMLLKQLRREHPEHIVDLLAPHITEETHKPVSDEGTGQEEYLALQNIEQTVYLMGCHYTTLQRKAQLTGKAKNGKTRYDALLHFLSHMERNTKGARQQYEQLLFGGVPAEVSE